MRCTNCGAELRPGVKFCTRCGTQRPASPAVAAQPGPSAKCANCGAELRPGIKFCTNCGAQQPIPRPPIDLPERPPARPAYRPAVAPPMPATPKVKRRWGWLLIAASAVAILVCFGVGVLYMVRSLGDLGIGEVPIPAAGTIEPSDELPGPEAAGQVGLSAQQQELVEEFGWPQSFSIVELEDANGHPVRYESWTYYDGEITYVFVDGVFRTWEGAESLSEGIIPTPYQPIQFFLGDTPNEVGAQAAGGEWMPIPGVDTIMEATEIYIAPQLFAGFSEGRLVFLEALTIALEGGEQ